MLAVIFPLGSQNHKASAAFITTARYYYSANTVWVYPYLSGF